MHIYRTRSGRSRHRLSSAPVPFIFYCSFYICLVLRAMVQENYSQFSFPMSGKSDRREDIASLFVFVFYGILVAEEKKFIFPLMGD